MELDVASQMRNGLAHNREQGSLNWQEQDSLYLKEIESIKETPTGLSKFEKTLVIVIGLITFTMLLLRVHTNIQLTVASRNAQDLEIQVESTKVDIDNLSQQVQELTQYDRLSKIAELYGLESHKGNIRNLSPKD